MRLFLNNALTIWHKMPENVPQIEGFHKNCYSILNGNRVLYTHKRRPRTLEEKIFEGVTLTQCTLHTCDRNYDTLTHEELVERARPDRTLESRETTVKYIWANIALNIQTRNETRNTKNMACDE